MKKIIITSIILLIMGCAQNKSSIGLEVPLITSGCAGFNESYSEATITSKGINVISNIISDNPCYKLTKAEISREDDKINVYFTFANDEANCINCLGVHTLIYTITGNNINRTGINITVNSYFNKTRTTHSFIT